MPEKYKMLSNFKTIKFFSKNIDFSLWGKQCIGLSKWTFFHVLVHCGVQTAANKLNPPKSDFLRYFWHILKIIEERFSKWLFLWLKKLFWSKNGKNNVIKIECMGGCTITTKSQMLKSYFFQNIFFTFADLFGATPLEKNLKNTITLILAFEAISSNYIHTIYINPTLKYAIMKSLFA